jgi:hypothetical protein
LRYFLNTDPAFGAIAPTKVVGSSDLPAIECHRVLQRERMAGHLDDRQFAEAAMLLEDIRERLSLIERGPAVKRRAAYVRAAVVRGLILVARPDPTDTDVQL